MKIETRFSPGDKVWIATTESVFQGTVGQVRVTVTDSRGLNGGYTEPGLDVAFDNYKPQKNYEEEYMLDETGIGSGSVFKLGKNIFANEIEAQQVHNLAKP